MRRHALSVLIDQSVDSEKTIREGEILALACVAQPDRLFDVFFDA